jgi:transposase
MSKFKVLTPRNQLTMLPRSVEEFVPELDSVRAVDALVEQFDLSEIESSYSPIGRRAFPPKILVKIIVYGKLRGIRSSRELARACSENLKFMFLVQNERPDFRTISAFRKRFIVELGELLKQTIRIGIEENLITLEHVVIDGTKLRANASANSMKSKEKLEEILQSLESSLMEDSKQEDFSNDDDDEPTLPPELKDKEKLRERVKEAIARDKQKTSLTDPDANFMKSRQGTHLSYNGQLAADGKCQMIVGAYISTAGADHGELVPMLEEIKATTGEDPKAVTTDMGYRATEGIVELDKRGITGFIPTQDYDGKRFVREDFVYDEEADEYLCPNGEALVLIREKKTKEASEYQSEDCSKCSMTKHCLKGASKVRTLLVSWHEPLLEMMRERMQTYEAKLMLRKRSAIVEPIFGRLKAQRKFQQLYLRGKEAVDSLWKLEAACLNIAKIVAARQKLQAI